MGGAGVRLVGGAELLEPGRGDSGKGVGVDRVSAGVVLPNPCGEDEILPAYSDLSLVACWQLSVSHLPHIQQR